MVLRLRDEVLPLPRDLLEAGVEGGEVEELLLLPGLQQPKLLLLQPEDATRKLSQTKSQRMSSC
jgi:hypothetical protein